VSTKGRVPMVLLLCGCLVGKTNLPKPVTASFYRAAFFQRNQVLLGGFFEHQLAEADLVGDDQVLGGEGCADVGGGLVGAVVGLGEVAGAVAVGEGGHVDAQALGAGGGADVLEKERAFF